MTKDYYKILEIGNDADIEEIRNSFRRLALRYHPDKCTDPLSLERMKEINEAYSLLKNPIKRLRYDREKNTTGKTKKHDTADNLFSFSPKEILGKSGDLLPRMHLSSVSSEDFDEVLKGQRMMKWYFIFFKAINKISTPVIKEISIKIEHYMKNNQHFLPEIYLILITKKAILIDELKLIRNFGSKLNISVFDYTTGKFYGSVNQMI